VFLQGGPLSLSHQGKIDPSHAPDRPERPQAPERTPLLNRANLRPYLFDRRLQSQPRDLIFHIHLELEWVHTDLLLFASLREEEPELVTLFENTVHLLEQYCFFLQHILEYNRADVTID
jgi:hypothetical protein